MKITIKMAGLLTEYLPGGGAASAAVLDVADAATPRDVIAQLGMPPDASYLVMLNGASVPRAERASRALAEGDTLAVMPPLKGG